MIVKTISATISVLMLSCSTVSVSSVTAPGARLANYHTYSWAQTPVTGDAQHQFDSVMDQRLRSALEPKLTGLGLTRANPGETAELLIAYSVGSHEKVAITNASPGFYGFYGIPEAYVYQEGNLSLEFIDPKTKKEVWHGVATAALDSSNLDQTLNQALTKLVAKYEDARKKEQTQVAQVR
ncbi:MAG: DUF4136 domain-containing protein [Bdellovibrionota bacterium]